MRAISFSVDTAQELPLAIAIPRGALTLRWNTSQEDVTIGGESYPAYAGAVVTSMSFSSDGTESNADVMIQTEADGLVDLGEGTRGLLDGWPISVKMFDPADPDGTAFEFLPGSTIGSVAEDTNGIATSAANGQLSKARAVITEHFSMSGREDLGDDRCKVNLDDYTEAATGEATGTYIVTLDALPDARATDPTWYVNGGLTVLSGNLNGYPKFTIRAWNPDTLEVTLALPILEADIPAGTDFEIHAGCDLTREMCFSRFNNIDNLRAETFAPPPDVNF